MSEFTVGDVRMNRMDRTEVFLYEAVTEDDRGRDRFQDRERPEGQRQNVIVADRKSVV